MAIGRTACENARPSGWVYIDVRGRDMAAVVHDLRAAIGRDVRLAPGISLSYSGQFGKTATDNAISATLTFEF